MAYKTVESICKAAIRDAFRIYTTAAITADMIQQAVDFYNASEPIVWRAFHWKTKKIEETAVPDSEGIITLGADVDIVRAVQPIDTDGDPGMLVWHEDEIRSAMLGNGTISSGKFDHMDDADDGSRRIKVNADDDVSTYKILAFRRFVKAEVSADYDSGEPSATPSDYRVLTWKLDQAESTLISFITDKLRGWKGADETGKWKHSLNGTIKDLREQEANEQLITPDEGSFGELGDW